MEISTFYWFHLCCFYLHLEIAFDFFLFELSVFFINKFDKIFLILNNFTLLLQLPYAIDQRKICEYNHLIGQNVVYAQRKFRSDFSSTTKETRHIFRRLYPWSKLSFIQSAISHKSEPWAFYRRKKKTSFFKIPSHKYQKYRLLAYGL